MSLEAGIESVRSLGLGALCGLVSFIVLLSSPLTTIISGIYLMFI